MKNLIEQKAALIGQMKDLNDKLKAENRGFTAEERATWDRMNADLTTLEGDVERAKRAEDIFKASVNAVDSVVEGAKMSKEEARARVNDEFRKLILYKGLGIGEKPDMKFLESRTNAQSVTDAKGGFLIPEGFSNELAVAEKAWGAMLNVSRIINTASGNDIPWPATNDTSNVGYQINEATSLETSATDVTFSKALTLKAYKWTSGIVRISREIMEDSYFNMETLLADLFGTRLGRGLNAAYTTGAGTTTIAGVVTGATNSSVSATATALTYANILNLQHSIDPAYRNNARFMFNDTTLAAIRTLVDQNDRPLWEPNLQVGAPSMILGSPFTINPDMASIGAGNKSVLFGDFSNYLIRKVAGDRLIVLRERFADTDEIGLGLITRTDGQLLDAGMHPIKYLVHAAS